MVTLPGGTVRSRGADWDSSLVAGKVVQPFAIDLTEVTADAYAACVSRGACSAEGVTQQTVPDRSWDRQCNYGHPEKGNHPMNCVSFDQAATYCRAEGKRLPTILEWKWAARGGPEARQYPWGNDAPTGQLCWQRRNEGTCAVGSFPAGDAVGGIHDMSGNVMEWTVDEQRPGVGGRTRLGGGFADAPTYWQGVSVEFGVVWENPASRFSILGFRCVK
jgi:formylglycine-generating enzyme required for sulfatase activity